MRPGVLPKASDPDLAGMYYMGSSWGFFGRGKELSIDFLPGFLDSAMKEVRKSINLLEYYTEGP